MIDKKSVGLTTKKVFDFSYSGRVGPERRSHIDITFSAVNYGEKLTDTDFLKWVIDNLTHELEKAKGDG